MYLNSELEAEIDGDGNKKSNTLEETQRGEFNKGRNVFALAFIRQYLLKSKKRSVYLKQTKKLYR